MDFTTQVIVKITFIVKLISLTIGVHFSATQRCHMRKKDKWIIVRQYPSCLNAAETQFLKIEQANWFTSSHARTVQQYTPVRPLDQWPTE